MSEENQKYTILLIVCILLVSVMTGTAEISGEKEIIFPEIAALTVGAIASPKQSWKTSRLRMILMIAICSVFGILVVNFSPFCKTINLIFTFFAAQILFNFSKTTFAPMISAAALPVLMGTESVIYPVSAVTMTVLTAFAQYVLEKNKMYEKQEFIPCKRPQKSDIAKTILRTFFAAIISIPTIKFNLNFCVAPPLLVAFTEFSNPKSKARNNPVKTCLIIFSCAFLGAISRIVFCEILSFPLTFAAVFSISFALILMKLSKQFIPPAAALGILPLIIQKKFLYIYPAEIAVGCIFFMLSAMCFREKKTDNISEKNRN